MITVTSSFIILIGNLGFSTALFKSYYDYETEKERRKVVNTALWTILIFDVAFIGFLYLFSGFFSKLIFNSIKYMYHFRLLLFSSFFGILKLIPFAIFRAKQKVKTYSLLSFVFFIFEIALNILFVIVLKLGLEGILYSILITSVISVVVSFVLIFKDIYFEFSLYEFSRLLKFGLPLVPASISLLVLSMANRFFLKEQCSIAEVGFYALGFQIGSFINLVLIQPLKLAWPPIMFSIQNKENCRQFYSRSLTYYLLISLFIVTLLSANSYEIIQIISTPEYIQSARVIGVISLTFVLMGVDSIINVGMPIRRKTYFAPFIIGFSAIVNLILNYLCIPKWGIMGAAFSTLSAYTVLIAIRFFINYKLLPIQYEYGRILRVILPFIVIPFVLNSIQKLVLLNEVTVIFVKSFLILILFPLMLLVTRFFNHNEILIMKTQYKQMKHILMGNNSSYEHFNRSQ
ncbi:polysaccharide biosynthesis C-terminal domain-containing protein [bacterium]|nr:polysaccharide biosynthesis C-terminal domain-containing protein [bacterium]